MNLYVLPANNFANLFGSSDAPTPKDDVEVIARKPDDSEFLVLSETSYPELTPQLTVPEGFIFTYRQDWGHVVTIPVVDRVIADLRKRAYGSIDEQLDMLYWDMKNGTNTWVAMQDAVKNKIKKRV